ncbi:MAG: DNA adenine methylase [Bacteroidales bacterium]|nr:DNA adenine methylase [Bacteroidales bacterium]
MLQNENIYPFEIVKEENEQFLNEQLITYIGNKRSLLSFIGEGIDIVKTKLDKKKLSTYDVFSGSGIVARFLKQYSSSLIVNDLEKYAEIINKCYLANFNDVNINDVEKYYKEIIIKLENDPLRNGFISRLYSPDDDKNIKKNERVFYTTRNARYIDTARQYIENVPEDIKPFLLAPLLSEASIHANTSGVFKGFYKNRDNGIGSFGGKNGDALLRILGDIHLKLPIFSNFECDVNIHRGDSNIISRCIEEIDLAYIDPPYNQHPYGSNYFMLNLICEYIESNNISNVSGIPTDWNRSGYNKKKEAYEQFKELVEIIPSKYLLISFNSEGFIQKDDMMNLLNKIGKVEILETKYNTFRGSRNLRNRSIHVKEFLYLVNKN